jgi:hypothetical protein
MKLVDPAVIRFANDRFYLAFNNRDVVQMSNLWSEDYPCVCIHPGSTPLLGREEILESWRDIFGGEGAGVQIVCHSPRVFFQGDLFSVVCFEQLPAGWLVATNNFVMESGRVRLVHHQASQCMAPAELNESQTVLQ